MEWLAVVYPVVAKDGNGTLLLWLTFVSYWGLQWLKQRRDSKGHDYEKVMDLDHKAAEQQHLIRQKTGADRVYLCELRNGSVNVAGHSLLRMHMKQPESLSFDTNSIYANLQGIPLRLFYNWVLDLRKGRHIRVHTRLIENMYPDRFELLKAHGTDSAYLFPVRGGKDDKFFGIGVLGFCNGEVNLTDDTLETIQNDFNKMSALLDSGLERGK